jgi:hypothetical protein
VIPERSFLEFFQLRNGFPTVCGPEGIEFLPFISLLLRA